MIEVWCEGCYEWHHISELSPRRKSSKFPRRVRRHTNGKELQYQAWDSEVDSR